MSERRSRCGQFCGPCYDQEQVLLKVIGGSWRYLDSGISCTGLIPAKDVEACAALGTG